MSVAEAWGKLEARRRVVKLASGQRGRLGSRKEGAARGTGRASGASGGPERAAVADRAPSADACAVSAAESPSLSISIVTPTASLTVAEEHFAEASREHSAQWLGIFVGGKFDTPSRRLFSTRPSALYGTARCKVCHDKAVRAP